MLTLSIEEATRPISPDPPRSTDYPAEVWYDNDGAVCAYGYTLNGRHCMTFVGLASFHFDGGTDVVSAVGQSPLRVDVIRDTFRRTVLPMALQVRGHDILHASAVRMPQGVVALCAVSETGKSTLACGLEQRGYPLWADDAVAFDISETVVRAIPLPFRLRLRPLSQAYFADRRRVDANHADTGRHYGAATESPAPLAAVCVLERMAGADTPVVVRQLPPKEAFSAVLTHACCFSLRDADRKRRMIRHYLDLAAGVPIYLVRFQAGLANLPHILDAVEQTVQGGATEPS
jgi:hypothetical protein